VDGLQRAGRITGSSWHRRLRRITGAIAATYPPPSDRDEMGYADPMRFESDDLALLAETEEVEIETSAPGGPAHRTIIWVVVDGEDAFVRSVNGARARWYREAVAAPAVTIHLGSRGLRASVEAATDPPSVQRTSDALVRKYTGITGLAEMLEPETLETTLKLEPA
jgi:hypothetical protein